MSQKSKEEDDGEYNSSSHKLVIYAVKYRGNQLTFCNLLLE